MQICASSSQTVMSSTASKRHLITPSHENQPCGDQADRRSFEFSSSEKRGYSPFSAYAAVLGKVQTWKDDEATRRDPDNRRVAKSQLWKWPREIKNKDGPTYGLIQPHVSSHGWPPPSPPVSQVSAGGIWGDSIRTASERTNSLPRVHTDDLITDFVRDAFATPARNEEKRRGPDPAHARRQKLDTRREMR